MTMSRSDEQELRDRRNADKLKAKFFKKSGEYTVLLERVRMGESEYTPFQVKSSGGFLPDLIHHNGNIYRLNESLVRMGEDMNQPVYKMIFDKSYDPMWD